MHEAGGPAGEGEHPEGAPELLAVDVRVAEQDRDVGLDAVPRVLGEGVRQAGADGGGQPVELVLEQRELPGPVQADERPCVTVAERVHVDPVAAQERDRGEDRGQALRRPKRGRAADAHRPARVDEEGDGETGILDPDLHDELMEASIHGPVDPAKLVPRYVRAVFGELVACGDGAALALAHETADERGQGPKAKPLELTQQLGVEQRALLGRIGSPRVVGRAARPRAHHASSGTSATTALTMSSGEMPFRSASKVSTRRWRRAGSITVRMSS